MKTIEERAMEYASEPLNDHYAIPAFIASENERQAYIAGATEQKAIDEAIWLKKACEWLKENARNYAYATVRCYTVADVCDIHKELVEDFKKAMEK